MSQVVFYVNSFHNPGSNRWGTLIHAYNLFQDIHAPKSGERYHLKSPPTTMFSAEDNVELISDFIESLTDLYNGNYKAGLKGFLGLEDTLQALNYDPEFLASVKFNLGNAYLMNGSVHQASLEYSKVDSLSKRDYSEYIAHNLGLPEKVPGFIKTILINNQSWMTQNLNVKVDSSWCYDNAPGNCDKFGRLYTWEAAREACTVFGDGWRLPTDEEGKTLRNEYGGRGKAYPPLIAGGSSGFDARLGGRPQYRWLVSRPWRQRRLLVSYRGGWRLCVPLRLSPDDRGDGSVRQRSAVRLLSTLPPGLMIFCYFLLFIIHILIIKIR